MRGGRADRDGASGNLDAFEFRDMRKVDHRRRRCEPLLHGRDQRHAARRVFRVAALHLADQQYLLPDGFRFVASADFLKIRCFVLEALNQFGGISFMFEI